MAKIKSIKFSEITMRNFMSYDQYTLKGIDKYKIIFISGKNAQGKSTLTSESPYYSLFGSPLRYKKISDLVSWGYDPATNDPTFSRLGLSFDMDTHVTNLTMTRNMLSTNDKFELEIDNDVDNTFFDLTGITKVPDFNKAVKALLDIDERKFSILYLKSPFSEVIFESDSDLLSSITKSQYINELRRDFLEVIKEMKTNTTNMSATIEKQNALSASIKKQLDEMMDADAVDADKEKLQALTQEILQLENNMKQIDIDINKCRAEYTRFNADKNTSSTQATKIDSYITQLKKDKQRLRDLTERGKCPTCEQIIGKDLYSSHIVDLDGKILKYSEMLDKNVAYLDTITAKLEDIESSASKFRQDQQSINNNLRSLSNMRTQLQMSLKNYNDNKSNNDEILKKIRNTIMNLNDDLTVLQGDLKIVDSISKVMLNKNSEYINKFYNQKIHSFNIIFKSILSKMTKGKYTAVEIKLNNKPTLNGHIEYESLSTSERKFVDISFVIAYIVYLSTKLKLKTFILDEFLDNYDKENIIHIYSILYEISTTYDLQLIITTNLADYVLNYMGDKEDILIEQLTK